MAYLLPVLFVVATWWLATVAILFGTARSAGRPWLPLAVAGLSLAGGFALIVATRGGASPAAACGAFLGALAVWAFHEVTFLFGHIGGPRQQACPDGATGWRRFALGVQTCLWHELAIVATVPAIVFALGNGGRRVALWTFVILWLMRWSAKLNIFLGVRNLHREYWPAQLQYLESYVRERRMNALFPWSIALGAAAVIALVLAATGAGDAYSRTGGMLLATLTLLAVIEHAFLMLPLDDGRLWRIALPVREPERVAEVNGGGTSNTMTAAALAGAKGDL